MICQTFTSIYGVPAPGRLVPVIAPVATLAAAARGTVAAVVSSSSSSAAAPVFLGGGGFLGQTQKESCKYVVDKQTSVGCSQASLLQTTKGK